MNSEEFLDSLLLKFDDGNTNIHNFGFKGIVNHDLNALDNFEAKKNLICISSSDFYENIEMIAGFKNINFLESIISLPVYKEDNNLLILIFNSEKTHNKCLFIDESDSLVHKTDSVDWTYANKELIDKITDTYNKFQENDTSIILYILDMFSTTSQDEVDELIYSEDKHKKIVDEFLELKSDADDFSIKKHRIISDELADNLLSLKQQQSIDDEISKHDVRADEIPQRIDSLLNDVMYYKKRQDPQNLLYKEGKRLINEDVQFRKLGKIADLHNIYFKNENDSILISTCKSCDSKRVYYNKDIADLKGEVFIELINISDSVLIDYLYEYLNSSNGLDELLYFSKGNNYITPDDIKNVKVPVPPIKIQKEIVSVARESREFFSTVDLLKKEFNSNILDYKRMKDSLNEFNRDIDFSNDNEITKLSRSWRHAYKGLIWPLAISYLSATKGGFETVEKKDNYLILFEFISAFNSIILLSGLPDDVYQNNFERIWNSRNPKEYNMMTFANWVYLSKNLSNVYKFNNFRSQLDEELFDKIADDKILNILEDAKDLRNDEFHGSHSNAYEAQEVIDKLDIYLEDLFDILEIYSNYKLIYVTGDVKSSKQAYNHRIILLNGPCAQPIYDNIICDTILQEKSLYLYNPKNNKKLLLNDNFIKFAPVDENKKRWALFVYYKTDKRENNAFYKCFQSNEKNIKKGITSLELDILGKTY